jgi:hypothetical protein
MFWLNVAKFLIYVTATPNSISIVFCPFVFVRTMRLPPSALVRLFTVLSPIPTPSVSALS